MDQEAMKRLVVPLIAGTVALLTLCACQPSVDTPPMVKAAQENAEGIATALKDAISAKYPEISFRSSQVPRVYGLAQDGTCTVASTEFLAEGARVTADDLMTVIAPVMQAHGYNGLQKTRHGSSPVESLEARNRVGAVAHLSLRVRESPAPTEISISSNGPAAGPGCNEHPSPAQPSTSS
ncbi:hypothetical protein [Psychromicrobium xiongbiense]|uniref:hypothetical protein n=1 Tax=Psychromicrobium xiongbiense TaxID=3051184 RepID=UPI002554FA3A|nr:hypothetical protein [Psychromicrobium sp. YIM S02556]